MTINLCVRVADFDLVKYIWENGINTDPNVRYNILYRPPEMLYKKVGGPGKFYAQNLRKDITGESINVNSFEGRKYTWSGKEDSYALGYTFIDILKDNKILNMPVIQPFLKLNNNLIREFPKNRYYVSQFYEELKVLLKFEEKERII